MEIIATHRTLRLDGAASWKPVSHGFSCYFICSCDLLTEIT